MDKNNFQTELRLPELIDLNQYVNAERRNRYIAAKLKQQETFKVATLAMQSLPKLKSISKVVFIWWHKNRRKDMDNVEFSQKFIWDGLVQAKIIPGDGWNYRPQQTVHVHSVNKSDPGVTLIIYGDKL